MNNNFKDILAALAEEGNLRSLPQIDVRGVEVICDGRSHLNLSSNDYLGVGASDLHGGFMAALATSGEFLLSNPSSRLITGNSKEYRELEECIGELYGGRSVLVLGSGYLLNSGLLPAISTKEDIILADKRIHASLIDGLQLGQSPWHRFAHNDMDHLEQLIKKHRGHCRELYIVTESLFSMDGDRSPIEAIVGLKEKYGCRIYLDEAHAFGVYGATVSGSPAGSYTNGAGVAAEMGLAARCDIIVATLGKAIASQGAFVVTDRATRELLVNKMRTLIFSTALPPISLRWSKYVIDQLPQMEGRREHLARLVAILGSQSHIIPIIAGQNERAIKMSEAMKKEGFWAMPVRYPTVPKGAARVRVSLSAAIKEEDIRRFSQLSFEAPWATTKIIK